MAARRITAAQPARPPRGRPTAPAPVAPRHRRVKAGGSRGRIPSMKFVVWLPNCRHLATPDVIRGTAVRAEQLGYDSVWVSDHVVVPHANVVNFGETVFDPLVTLALVARVTRPRPLRPPPPPPPPP